ncbi:hypothetical protein K413DRAFT_0832 [Clostridium sp. ASBs410]|nr:hypothetical protein K413DRAFT_0832 [Clostridium sp. ASBs410]
MVTVTYSCKSCRYRNRCFERSRRYACKDYERREYKVGQAIPNNQGLCGASRHKPQHDRIPI